MYHDGHQPGRCLCACSLPKRSGCESRGRGPLGYPQSPSACIALGSQKSLLLKQNDPGPPSTSLFLTEFLLSLAVREGGKHQTTLRHSVAKPGGGDREPGQTQVVGTGNQGTDSTEELPLGCSQASMATVASCSDSGVCLAHSKQKTSHKKWVPLTLSLHGRSRPQCQALVRLTHAWLSRGSGSVLSSPRSCSPAPLAGALPCHVPCGPARPLGVIL